MKKSENMYLYVHYYGTDFDEGSLHSVTIKGHQSLSRAVHNLPCAMEKQVDSSHRLQAMLSGCLVGELERRERG